MTAFSLARSFETADGPTSVSSWKAKLKEDELTCARKQGDNPARLKHGGEGIHRREPWDNAL